MAVIIDEFQIQVESPPEQNMVEPPPVTTPPTLTPQDFKDILRHQSERQGRLWAH